MVTNHAHGNVERVSRSLVKTLTPSQNHLLIILMFFLQLIIIIVIINIVMNNICDLPEGCLSHILSLTTPRDILRSSAVSKQFLSASESDTVWRNFLPSDCENVISHSSSPFVRDQFHSKKELFLHLSRFPVLLENGTKSFGLDKWTGKKCYMIGARALGITWGSTPDYWSWVSVPESRFLECAELVQVCWLEIKGNIDTTLLSPNSTYGVYFVFIIDSPGLTGFEYCPVKVSIAVVAEDGLRRDDHELKRFYLKTPEYEGSEEEEEVLMGYAPEELPVVRDDGWLEIEMGRYQVGSRDECETTVLEMALKEIEQRVWKSGLVVHGIELRPLCYSID